MSRWAESRVSRTMARRRSLRRRRRGRSEGNGIGGLLLGHHSSSSPKKKASAHFLAQNTRPKARWAHSSHTSLKQIGHFSSRRSLSSIWHRTHSIACAPRGNRSRRGYSAFEGGRIARERAG